jgi:SAM-dependent methyltransferase
MIRQLKYNIPYPLDSVERTVFHKNIIANKVFLKRLYTEWYNKFIQAIPELPRGKMIELGSGGGFLKELEPRIIATDILPLPSNDLTFSALEMPFENQELSAIFMVDTFHHIPDSRLFLTEADRVLKKDGMIIMIEPANTFWGRFVYKNFHHEPFEPGAGWTIPASGPLSGANGALPWIVFQRDFEKFNTWFPELKLLETNFHTPLMYLLSGGVSFKQLFPDFSYSLFRGTDKFLSSLSRQLSMFVTIKIKKL